MIKVDGNEKQLGIIVEGEADLIIAEVIVAIVSVADEILHMPALEFMEMLNYVIKEAPPTKAQVIHIEETAGSV